jgi:pSer/pThr/pTyr-binding forkhead associated (FHA) protein
MVLSLLPQSSDFSYENSNDFMQQQVVNGLLLRIMQGEDFGAVYKLNDLLQGKSQIITIGCNDPFVNNILPVTENFTRFISRKHCTLERSDGNQWFIRDGQWDRNATTGWKQSLNGTFVNSTEVPPTGIPIRPGDIISIGDIKFRVEGY